MESPLALAFTIIASSALTALAALALLALTLQRRPARPTLLDAADEQDTVFVFDNETLVDSSDTGAALLAALGVRENATGGAARRADTTALRALLTFLQPRFPNLRSHLETLAEAGRLTLEAQDESGLILRAHWRDGLAHLVLSDPRAEGASVAMDRLSYTALQDELRTLRDCVSHAPVLIWRRDRDGQVTWANGSYLQATARCPENTGKLGWPLPDLFPEPVGTPQGAQCTLINGTRQSFDHVVHADATGTLHYAIPGSDRQDSETARRDVMHSLTRTFATLPIGLAVFDTARRLQVFNPALVDLTGLDPQFMTERPGFEQFMHRLRERRMLPEARDFRSWRSALLEIERAADSGSYQEEWLLPHGQTYRVSGRPQPDGSIAFFFEDVTSETELARGFRAEIETAQSVIDSLPDAMAVFSTQGVLLLSNTAYRDLWHCEPCETVGQIGLSEALNSWRMACQPSPVWDSLIEFIRSTGDRGDGDTDTHTSIWSVAMLGGRILHLSARRLPEMRVLVRFGTPQADARASPLLREKRVHDRILSTALDLARNSAEARCSSTPSDAAAESHPTRHDTLPAATDRVLRVRHRSSRAIGSAP